MSTGPETSSPQEAGPQEAGGWSGSLPMVSPPSPEQLAQERLALVELESKGWGARARGYMKLLGPGYMQSALTLGSGSVAASLFGGALLGLALLRKRASK